MNAINCTSADMIFDNEPHLTTAHLNPALIVVEESMPGDIEDAMWREWVRLLDAD